MFHNNYTSTGNIFIRYIYYGLSVYLFLCGDVVQTVGNNIYYC